jgi:phosphatidylglycerophosphatase C
MDLALFDFDGTITTTEMFPAFVHHAVEPRRLMVGKVLLAPLVVGYKLGLVSGSTIRSRIVRFGFRDVDEVQYRESGRRFASEVLPGVVRPEALERIAWHKGRGDTVVVVSGSFDCYLSYWCNQHGVDLLCSALEVSNGRLTGKYAGRQCVSTEKIRRVQRAYDLAHYSEIYAYGDTKEDLAMLSIATKRYYRWKEAA